MRLRRLPVAWLVSGVLLSACGSNQAPPPSTDTTGDEARYVAAAHPFVKAMVEQDHATAYGFVSSHLRDRLSLDAFTQKNRAAFAELGTPLGLAEGGGAEVDPAILVGPEHASGDDELEKAANRILAAAAVGDMPESIPAAIRKASVTSNVLVGKNEEGEERYYILTAVLVEDAGLLRVGHYWFRAAGMLDD